jgi:hypothetical protein
MSEVPLRADWPSSLNANVRRDAGLLPLLKIHCPPRLTYQPGQWLQCQANGSNVCRVLRGACLLSTLVQYITIVVIDGVYTNLL